jgi:hypothetical protein
MARKIETSNHHKADSASDDHQDLPPTTLRLYLRRGGKSGDSCVVAWREVHAAYRGVVRKHWLATRGGLPRRSAKGTRGGGACAAPLSRDDRLRYEDKVHGQICAPLN